MESMDIPPLGTLLAVWELSGAGTLKTCLAEEGEEEDEQWGEDCRGKCGKLSGWF